MLFFSRYYFSSFLEAFVDPVWVVNRSFRLVYMNPAAMKKFSLNADYAVGKRCHLALFEEASHCPFCSLERLFSSGELTNTTFTLLDTDGRNHVYALNTYPCFGVNGEVDYGLAVCVDKSEGADLLAEVSRLQGLAAMGEYSAELSHEIRNPLNSIEIQMALLQRMAARLPDAETTAFLKVVEVVRAESRRLNSLAGDFLKIQKSRRLTLADCDPFAVVGKVAELLCEEAREVDVDIRLRLRKEAVFLRADSDKLQQAFMNLMKNALEALAEGKREGAFLEVEGRLEDDQVVLTFADNGPGIPFARQAKIFDLFFTTKTGGTGIGLHLCRDVIRAHDGEISFVSDENCTVFTVVLPRMESDV
ncbi:MAG: PAS domain-containing protein [Deltaproteobacteria bacterium]|nr:PAS domain-containing protein [Deltaproteobacteria bacterium]